ncbi:DJ-1/PfpI family protein [filamentous cyanobacterium LEGE 11480]|uniref:DJ-1/PfpI family protein n=1 Tax=Romeriopsis navalis LEGE 11480 TaxID=2777977 RepID=A0A928VN41_9CYAN|nr:DJ-1/PfpI family protein [Romeriopsis navalis]MBE9031365.1 DJ-1/PfpI family protein [Romeriopsis navalis LEGE 11480]
MTELQTNWPHYVIGIVIYPGMTTLDIVGPQTVFAGLPNVTIHRVWKTLAPVTGDDGMVILPDTTFTDCPPVDVICIGGGRGQSAIIDDTELLNFLKLQGEKAKFVTSVCGGSEFLAKAGLLNGYRAATHWAARPLLAKLGVEVGTERVVVDRNRMTGGGVTAGIDFGLTVAEALYDEDVAKISQLLMEYDPAPPYDVGSPDKAGPELIEKAILYMAQTLGTTL